MYSETKNRYKKKTLDMKEWSLYKHGKEASSCGASKLPACSIHNNSTHIRKSLIRYPNNLGQVSSHANSLVPTAPHTSVLTETYTASVHVRTILALSFEEL